MIPPRVELVPVDEDILEELVHLALHDTDPDEVTPPLDPGWGPARVAWLRDFHRRSRPGLTGGDQLTAAVRVDGRVRGSVRLERLPTGDLEYGLWLARTARGQGFSSVLLDLVARRAVEAGAQQIVVRTTTDNGPAMATLRRAGAKIESGPGSEVSAVIDLLERG